jgi:hypothetical protein
VTDLVPVEPNEILDPRSGELVPLGDARKVADLLAYLREQKRVLQFAMNVCQGAILEEFARQGTKTLTFAGLKVTAAEKSEVVWDIDVLRELQDAGLPEERFNQLVRTEVSYKVDRSVARQIAAANENYAAIIEAARTVVEKPAYVTVAAA